MQGLKRPGRSNLELVSPIHFFGTARSTELPYID